jgi:hypothetical protein
MCSLPPPLQDGNDFERGVDPRFFAGDSAASRLFARAARQRIEAAHAVVPVDSSAADECHTIIQNCHGKPSCDLEGCVPEELQYACVNEADFALLDNGGVGEGIVLQFGSSKVSWGSHKC